MLGVVDLAGMALVGVLCVGARGTRTWPTLLAWLLTGALPLASSLGSLVALRVLAAVVFCAFWGLALGWPSRLGLTGLTIREQACDQALRRLSSEARAAVAASGDWEPRLSEIRRSLEALEVPDVAWGEVRDALVLDLLARPPAVGRGVTQTPRLVWWPWRAAVDRRIVGAEFTDALSQLRRPPTGDADTRSAEARYDEFLRIVAGRISDYVPKELGPGATTPRFPPPPEADRLVRLVEEAPAPNGTWRAVRDALVAVLSLELEAAATRVEAEWLDRFESARCDLESRWQAAGAVRPGRLGSPLR